MPLIDFDSRFASYLNAWVEKNRKRFPRPEQMEDEVEAVYLKFLNTPASWLNGTRPGDYFDRYGDATELCTLLGAYIREDVPVPDPLLGRLLDLGDEDALLALIRDREATCAARMHGIDLLRQMESSAPMVDYIRWQAERDEAEELLDNALESLRAMGDKMRKPAKVAFLAAGQEGKEALLDVLCEFPGDDDVFAFALNCFQSQPQKRGLFAGYLAKLDDDRALEELFEAAESDDIDYIDFIEVRSAIERLGGEAPVRDFSKDPAYKAVRRRFT